MVTEYYRLMIGKDSRRQLGPLMVIATIQTVTMAHLGCCSWGEMMNESNTENVKAVAGSVSHVLQTEESLKISEAGRESRVANREVVFEKWGRLDIFDKYFQTGISPLIFHPPLLSSPLLSTMQAIHDWVSTVAQEFLHFRQHQTFSGTIPRIPQSINDSMVREYFQHLEEPASFREAMKTYIGQARSRQWLQVLNHESALPYASSYRKNVWYGFLSFDNIYVGVHAVMQDLIFVLINTPKEPLDQCLIAARILLWELVIAHGRGSRHEFVAEVIVAWLFGLISVQVQDTSTSLYILLVVFYFKFITEPAGRRLRNSFLDEEYTRHGLAPPEDSSATKPCDNSQFPSSKSLESIKLAISTELKSVPYDYELYRWQK